MIHALFGITHGNLRSVRYTQMLINTDSEQVALCIVSPRPWNLFNTGIDPIPIRSLAGSCLTFSSVLNQTAIWIS